MGMLRGFVVAVESVVQRTWVRCGASCGESTQQSMEPAMEPRQSARVAGEQRPGQRTNTTMVVVLDQKVLDLAKTSIHNAVNVCDCGAHDAMFEVLDKLFEEGVCNVEIMEAVRVVDAVKVACKCESAVKELEVARIALNTILEGAHNGYLELQPSTVIATQQGEQTNQPVNTVSVQQKTNCVQSAAAVTEANQQYSNANKTNEPVDTVSVQQKIRHMESAAAVCEQSVPVGEPVVEPPVSVCEQ